MDMNTDRRRLNINQDSVISNGVLGVILFIATELMFFGGLISAFIVNRSENLGAWPPSWQPRLPVGETAFNTVILLLSAVTMFLAVRESSKSDKKRFKMFLYATMAGGAIFVLLQGREWVLLVNAGMTTSSSLFAAFFYTIVGMHGLHVLLGLTYMTVSSFNMIATEDIESRSKKITATSAYWYFVVFLWPVLYYLVYLLPNS